jgi:hypothetical protein
VGGQGGGGAGGTVKVFASVLAGSGAIDTAGGAGGDSGGDGRLVLGLNTAGLVPASASVAGAQVISISQGGRHVGSRALNHHLSDGATETPYIPGLVDGADAFGLTGLSPAEPELAALLQDAPPTAAAALCLMDQGPADLAADWDGFDMLLMVNLLTRPLAAPRLGVGDSAYVADLKQGGFARNPMFGGGGYDLLGELPAGGVYALLVPEGSTHFNMTADGCPSAHEAGLGCGEAVYMVPEPTTMGLLALLALSLPKRRGLAVLIRRRGGKRLA